ncbi:MAG: NTP transferase domain-containing protein [Clostridia bacterium]|nr:NTP transferase domain-containing protein [Clostridia bacterium]
MSGFVAVLLCAGKGSRMNDDSTNKVCFPVNGIPAVRRTIDNMRKAGIDKFIVVVGHKADKVMECLSCYDNIAYAYQAEQNGTGNAALMALNVLDTLGYNGAALICMGDKIISTDVITKLIECYKTTGSKNVFAVQPKAFNEGGGRIAMKGDKVCGIYEQTDSYILKLAELSEQNEAAYISALEGVSLNEKKKRKVIDYAVTHKGELDRYATLSGERFSHFDIESSDYVNTATYLCDVKATIAAINKLDNDNAQGEIYLTDAINIMAAENGAKIIPISAKEEMLTFATKDELAEVSDYFASIEKE